MLLVCLVFCSMGAYANISINWTWDLAASAYVKEYDGITDLPQGSLVQLIYSPDNVISPLDDANPLVPGGGETLLDSRATGGFGYDGTWDLGVHQYGVAGQYHSGYVYERVFQVPFANTPVAGDHYKDGLVILQGGDPEVGGGATKIGLFDSDLYGGDITINQTIIPVPEPATMSLLGLGLVVAGLRRKMRQ